MDTITFIEPSFGEMLDLVLAERLVDEVTVRPTDVVIRRRSETYAMSLDEGRTFLLGLLLSHWDHALELPEPGDARPVGVMTDGHAVLDAAEASERRLGERVDRLVKVAASLGLLTDGERRPEAEEVVLALPDVTVTMSYRDAIEYLTTCITDAMPRAGRRAWESRSAV